MEALSDEQKFWKTFPKMKADKSAFYSVYKLNGIYFVSMYYSKDNALQDSNLDNGKVYSYQQLLSQLGTGKTFFFTNFYLS